MPPIGWRMWRKCILTNLKLARAAVGCRRVGSFFPTSRLTRALRGTNPSRRTGIRGSVREKLAWQALTPLQFNHRPGWPTGKPASTSRFQSSRARENVVRLGCVRAFPHCWVTLKGCSSHRLLHGDRPPTALVAGLVTAQSPAVDILAARRANCGCPREGFPRAGGGGRWVPRSALLLLAGLGTTSTRRRRHLMRT